MNQDSDTHKMTQIPRLSIAPMARYAAQGLIIFVISILLLEGTLQLLSFFVDKKSRAGSSGENQRYKIVTVGDSHTFGLFVEKEQAWPAVLQTMFDTNKQSVTVTNLGWPGTNSTTINKSFNAILNSEQPDMIIFMAGVNDYWTEIFFDDPDDHFAQVVRWAKENSRAYKAFLILYKGHYKKELKSIGETRRFVEERNTLTDEQLNEKVIAYIVSRADPDTGYVAQDVLALNGELLTLGMSATVNTPRDKKPVDALHKRYQSTIHYSVSQMVKKLEGKKTKLVIMTYPGVMEFSWMNHLLREAAAEQGLLLIDNELSQIYSDCANDITCHGYLLSDSHPTVLGHKYIAENIYKKISPLLAENSNYH